MNRLILATSLALSLLTYRAALGAESTKAPVKVECATCNDGKVMWCANPADHRGFCSGHQGVASYTDGSPVKSHTRKTEYK